MVSRRKITTVKGPRSKREAELYLNATKGVFYARVPGGKLIEHPHQKECEKLVAEEIDRVAEGTVWAPSIVVEATGGGLGNTERHFGSYGGGSDYREFNASVSFGFYRCELAEHEGEKQVRPFLVDGLTDENAEWLERCYRGNKREYARRAEETRNERAEERRTGGDISTFHDRDSTVLPYSEETWAALHSIRDATGKLNAQINAILSSGEIKALHALAARFGVDRQLGPGTKPKRKRKKTPASPAGGTDVGEDGADRRGDGEHGAGDAPGILPLGADEGGRGGDGTQPSRGLPDGEVDGGDGGGGEDSEGDA